MRSSGRRQVLVVGVVGTVVTISFAWRRLRAAINIRKVRHVTSELAERAFIGSNADLRLNNSSAAAAALLAADRRTGPASSTSGRPRAQQRSRS